MSITLLIYDYILTLPMEVSLIWRAKWTVMKVLYVIQRYLPFEDTVIVLLHCTPFYLLNFSVSHFRKIILALLPVRLSV